MEKLKFDGAFQAHQGDVQMHSLSELPANVTKVAKTFTAKSEKSGHAHALCGDYELYVDEKGTQFVVVGADGATMNHTGYQNLTAEYWDTNAVLPVADHKPTRLGQGVYHIGIQRRIDPFKSVWEKVLD